MILWQLPSNYVLHNLKICVSSLPDVVSCKKPMLFSSPFLFVLCHCLSFNPSSRHDKSCQNSRIASGHDLVNNTSLWFRCYPLSLLGLIFSQEKIRCCIAAPFFSLGKHGFPYTLAILRTETQPDHSNKYASLTVIFPIAVVVIPLNQHRLTFLLVILAGILG